MTFTKSDSRILMSRFQGQSGHRRRFDQDERREGRRHVTDAESSTIHSLFVFGRNTVAIRLCGSRGWDDPQFDQSRRCNLWSHANQLDQNFADLFGPLRR